MSALLKDMFYIGRKSQVEWEREQLKTIYIIRPNEWIHCYRNDSNETIGGLFSHILLKKGINDTNPVLSYRGKPLPEEHQLNDHNKQVFILSDGLFPDHGGHMWSCGHCKNPKTGLMQGSLRKTQFEKEHNKPECYLFQEKLLDGKGSWGDTNKLDKRERNSYDRPTGHPTVPRGLRRTSKKKDSEKSPSKIVTPMEAAVQISKVIQDTGEKQKTLEEATKEALALVEDNIETKEKHPAAIDEHDADKQEDLGSYTENKPEVVPNVSVSSEGDPNMGGTNGAKVSRKRKMDCQSGEYFEEPDCKKEGFTDTFDKLAEELSDQNKSLVILKAEKLKLATKIEKCVQTAKSIRDRMIASCQNYQK